MPSTTAKKAAAEEVVVETEVKEEVKKKKEHKPDDGIPCASITSGGLYVVGDKSENLYHWLDFGDVVEVEYQDIMAAIRTKKPFIFNPNVVIQDKEFLEEHKDVEKIYGKLYAPSDLQAIFALAPNKMKQTIESLPDGVKATMKDMAIRAIENGTLDSVQRIRILDDLFGTQMLIKMAQ